MKLRKLTAAAIIASALLSGCGYDQPTYVIGKYTCVDPYSGQPDYCVEYSDGSSALVPFYIYDDVYYGSTLSYRSSHWYYSTPRYRRYAPDVYHVRYRTHSYSYTGMSYRNRKGVVVYHSYSYHGSYHGRF